eukprot:g1358.t1
MGGGAGKLVPATELADMAVDDEIEQLNKLESEDIFKGGWKMTKNYEGEWTDRDLKCRVSQRPLKEGSKHTLLRVDVKVRRLQPPEVFKYVFGRAGLPKGEKWKTLAKIDDQNSAHYWASKKNDYCVKFTSLNVDNEDKRIMLAVRSTTNDDCPPKDGLSRTYMYRSWIFERSQVSNQQDDVYSTVVYFAVNQSKSAAFATFNNMMKDFDEMKIGNFERRLSRGSGY